MNTKGLLYTHTTLLVALALLTTSTTLQHYLKPLANVLAAGVSNFKVLLLIAYPLVLTMPWYTSWTAPKHTEKVMFISVFIVFLSGLLQIGLLAENPGVPVDQRAIYFEGKEYSSNSLLHIHSTKTALSIIPSLFSEKMVYRYDAGMPYHSFLPSWSIITHAVLFLIASITILLSGLNVKNRGLSEQILFILLTYCVFKNMIDGGILNTQALPSLLGLIILCRRNLNPLGFFSWITIGLLIHIAAAKIMGLQYTSPVATSATFLLFLTAAYTLTRKKWWLGGILTVILLLATYTPINPPRELNTYTADLSPNTTIAILSLNARPSSNPSWHLRESYPVAQGTHRRMQITEQTTTKDVISHLGGFTTPTNIVISGRDCEENMTIRRQNTLATPTPPRGPDHNMTRLKFRRDRFQVQMKDCTAAKESHMVAALNEAGVKRGAWYIPERLIVMSS